MAVTVVHMSSVHSAIDNRILNKECRSLAQAGYDVVLLAPHDREEVIQGVQIRPLGQWKSRLGRLMVGSVEALRRALAEGGDVYHLHDPELLFLAPLLRWRSRAAVIYDMHENVPKALASKTWIPQVLRPAAATLWRRLETLLLRTKMPVVFAERSYAKDYNRLSHTVVVENMVPSSLASVESPKYADFTVVYVGVVTRGRGIGVTLAALESLWEMGETVRFECVGPIYDQSLLGGVGSPRGTLGGSLACDSTVGSRRRKPCELLLGLTSVSRSLSFSRTIPNHFRRRCSSTWA
jgi:glycosyltransferase involved in cell wall biosynthesis